MVVGADIEIQMVLAVPVAYERWTGIQSLRVGVVGGRRKWCRASVHHRQHPTARYDGMGAEQVER